MSEINYDDKVDLIVDTGIDDVFKVTASDMNQIKSVVNGNADEVGDITTLTTTDKTSVVNAINELETDKLETSAVVNEASTDTNKIYSANYLNDKLVSVGATAPTDGTRVWFAKSKNLLDEKTLRQGSGYDTTITNRVFFPSNYYLEPGTYTFYTNLDTTNYKYAVGIATKKYPDPVSYVYDSGWQTLDHVTFTLSQGGYLGVGVAKSDRTSNITPSDISNYHFMLNEGTTATTYEPYVNPSINVDGEKMHFDNYSYGEQIIGKWVDGKPLYRRVYQITNPSASNTDYADVSSIGIYRLVRLYGYYKRDTGTFGIPFYDNNDNYSVMFLSSVNKLRGRFANVSGITDVQVVIEYTKTTD